MLKPAAILFASVLAAISITACVEGKNTSESTPETDAIKKAELIKATKAAIVIDSYEIGTNKVMPANNGSMNNNNER
jgi:hypothetical protein